MLAHSTGALRRAPHETHGPASSSPSGYSPPLPRACSSSGFGIVLSVHHGQRCLIDTQDYTLCSGTDAGYYAVRVLAYGMAGSLAPAVVGLLLYLERTGPNPPR